MALKRFVFFFLGLLAVVLSILGAVLPLLPTAPFVLLAAWCFSKSSPKFEAWLLRHPRMGPFIVNWRERRVVPLRAKQLAWGGMALSCSVSAVLLPLPLGLLPALVCSGVAFYLYRLPSA
jgi:hypothetical protein